MAKDPVCGMAVDEKAARFKAEKEGKTYYFCSQHCLDQFLGGEEAEEKEIRDLKNRFVGSLLLSLPLLY